MRVPRLIPQETIKTPPTPTATAPGPEAFGGAIASALSQSGAQLEAHARRMQEERDAIKGLNLVVKAQQRVTDMLYGEEGLLLRQGLEADGSSKEFLELYPQIIDEFVAEAENDNQRNIVVQSMLRQLAAYQGQLAKHEAAELQKAKNQELQATLASLSETAIASLGDPETMAVITEEIERVAVALAGNYGEEVVVSLVNETMDKIHSGVISNLLANDAIEAAKNYYEQNKEEMSTASRTKVEGFITNKEQVVFVQEKGYEIFQQFGLGNEAQALEYIRENFTGELENKLMTYVQGVYVDERRFEAERYDNYLNSIIVRISSAGSLTEALRIIEESNLNAKDKLSLGKQVRSNYEGSDVGVWESIKAFEEILYRTTRPEGHPDAFRNENEILASFGGRLTKSQQATIYQAWRMRDAHPELGNSIINAMNNYNIPEGLYHRFASDVYNAINSKETAEKRVLSNPEIEATIKDVVQKNSDVYLRTDYSGRIPSEVDQYVKDKHFASPENLRNYLEFKEVYLEFIDAMVGSTGRAAIAPTTYYDLADALLEDVVVSRGFFKSNKLKGFEIYRMGGALREAPDGSLQWYMNQDGNWVPAWEYFGGAPVDRGGIRAR